MFLFHLCDTSLDDKNSSCLGFKLVLLQVRDSMDVIYVCPVLGTLQAHSMCSINIC